MKYYIKPPFIFAAIVLLCVAACKKTNKKPVATLSGTAVRIAVVSHTDTLPLSNQSIQVLDKNTGFTYTLLTDLAGRFSIAGLESGNEFRIAAIHNRNDSIEYKSVYKADTTLPGNKFGNLRLIARLDTTDYNAVMIGIRDRNGGRIEGAKVIGYSSGELARADTGYKGFGSIFQLRTNSQGNCLAMQLPPEPLYIRSEYQTDTGRTRLRNGVDTILVKKYRDTLINIK